MASIIKENSKMIKYMVKVCFILLMEGLLRGFGVKDILLEKYDIAIRSIRVRVSKREGY